MKARVISGMAAMMLALMLAGCGGAGGNDALNRRRAELFGKAAPTAQAATAIPTARPTVAPVQQAAGSVSAAAGIDRDGDSGMQFVTVGLLIALGFPAFWVMSLRKSGARS